MADSPIDKPEDLIPPMRLFKVRRFAPVLIEGSQSIYARVLETYNVPAHTVAFPDNGSVVFQDYVANPAVGTFYITSHHTYRDYEDVVEIVEMRKSTGKFVN